MKKTNWAIKITEKSISYINKVRTKQKTYKASIPNDGSWYSYIKYDKDSKEIIGTESIDGFNEIDLNEFKRIYNFKNKIYEVW